MSFGRPWRGVFSKRIGGRDRTTPMNTADDARVVAGPLASADAIESAALVIEPDQINASEKMDEDPRPENTPVVDLSTSSPSSPAKPKTYLNGREKTHVCPVPNCVKAYLNPNGLRYHLRTGRCITVNGKPCERPTSAVKKTVVASLCSTVNPAATTSEALRPIFTKISAAAPSGADSLPAIYFDLESEESDGIYSDTSEDSDASS
ncbi:hypothetical protein C8J57DRAFT_1519209 [Mycena rebaudengoi]|nr:hypothetical protein C8J57DRAFT_1519209 [Mycena rebaudengoi]